MAFILRTRPRPILRRRTIFATTAANATGIVLLRFPRRSRDKPKHHTVSAYKRYTSEGNGNFLGFFNWPQSEGFATAKEVVFRNKNYCRKSRNRPLLDPVPSTRRRSVLTSLLTTILRYRMVIIKLHKQRALSRPIRIPIQP